MQNLLTQITSNLINAIESKLDRMIELAPYILGALSVFLFGWILAIMSEKLILSLGHKIKLEIFADKIGLKHFLERHKFILSSSEVVAKGTKGYLIFIFFVEATKIAQLTEVAEFLSKIVSYIPDVIIAIFIMLVGIRIGNTLESIISTSLNFTKTTTAYILGVAARYTMITFAVLAALSQLQIAEILIQTLFIGFIAMLTISGGLAFGLGGKDVVKELLNDLRENEVVEMNKGLKKKSGRRSK